MSEEVPNVRNEFAESIGELNLAWTGAHDFVYRIFQDVSGLTEKQARAIFFSIRSDSLQREITKKVVQATLQDGEYVKPVEELAHILGRLKEQASVRNETVHAMWSVHFFTDDNNTTVAKIAKQPTQKTMFEQIQDNINVGYPDYSKVFRTAAHDINAIGFELVEWWQTYARPLAAKT